MNGEECSVPDVSYTDTPPFDPQQYRAYVGDLDFTDEQKDELLRTLFSIMSSFVRLGFSVEAVQYVLPALAQNASETESDGLQGFIASPQFNDDAGDAAERD